MGRRCGEEAELAFAGGGVSPLLGHHLNHRLLSGTQGVRTRAIPVCQAVLLDIGAAQLHILHHHLGNVQRMGLGAHLRFCIAEDAKFADHRHLPLRQHVHIVLHMLDAHILRLFHGIVIEGICIAATRHSTRIGVDGHTVIPLIRIQSVHAIDKAPGLKTGIHVGLVVGALRLIDLTGGLLDGLGHINKALSVHAVGGIDVLALGGNLAVNAVTEQDGAVGVVDHTVGVLRTGAFQAVHYSPFRQVPVCPHIDSYPIVHGLEVGVVYNLPIFIQHTGVEVGIP